MLTSYEHFLLTIVVNNFRKIKVHTYGRCQSTHLQLTKYTLTSKRYTLTIDKVHTYKQKVHTCIHRTIK